MSNEKGDVKIVLRPMICYLIFSIYRRESDLVELEDLIYSMDPEVKKDLEDSSSLSRLHTDGTVAEIYWLEIIFLRLSNFYIKACSLIL